MNLKAELRVNVMAKHTLRMSANTLLRNLESIGIRQNQRMRIGGRMRGVVSVTKHFRLKVNGTIGLKGLQL